MSRTSDRERKRGKHEYDHRGPNAEGMPRQWCCRACRADMDCLRKGGDGIDERVEAIAEVLHGRGRTAPDHNARRPSVGLNDGLNFLGGTMSV